MFSIGYIADLMVCAVASGTVALTLTASHITKPWRHRYMAAPYMLGELINCPYCMAHWTAVPFAMWLTRPGLMFFIVWFAIVGLSAIFIGVVQRLFLFRESENEELRELIRKAAEALKQRENSNV